MIETSHHRKRAGRIALGLGGVAFLAVLLTLGGPGMTSDEPIDVQVGRHYVENLDAVGRLYAGLLRGDPPRRDADRLFRDNAQHPPLGRWLVGFASVLAGPFEGLLGGPDPFSVHAARLAPAAAFGLLVGLLVWEAGRRLGQPAGAVAGLALLLMPRAFAHGHFATLDTFLCLTWTLALLGVIRATGSRRPVLAMVGAGGLWGLALLTKIHAWLLPPLVLVWAFGRLPWRRALAAVGAWALAGLAVLLVGWPWLWFDTAARLRAFLGTSVERLPLRVQYFGQVYLDREVPWHYPWVYFAATVPVGLHLLGTLGLASGWRARREDPAPLLLAGSILLWLVVFSTNAPVYDGERLFLVAFPLWALLIGRGAAAAWRWAAPRRWARAGLVALVLAQGYGLVALHPFGLSYYNLLVGGLPGAERLGLELTYWGDAVDAPLLGALARRVEPGQTAALAPTLHHLQAPAATTQALYERGVVLQDESRIGSADWVVIYRRSAYWTPEVRELVLQNRPVILRTRQGVWLSGLWRGPALENGRDELKKFGDSVQSFQNELNRRDVSRGRIVHAFR